MKIWFVSLFFISVYNKRNTKEPVLVSQGGLSDWESAFAGDMHLISHNKRLEEIFRYTIKGDKLLIRLCR